ncbi:glycosyltransferase family 2 protein [Varunaivibrio sulfuroxidans]|uniref:Glycosyltransferase involved in cell wall biosynthesis n=1 Tax=Varunaivibrio sulfuroxidans TaxID=1773489 RepID=A0A4R3JIS9_9PROT|nr:glycosyltransferase family 2 protein [Varunaivibrio sulfuroxidans]TCS64720.1 glycosyltransferase involved in cell wall biosynthesis [Varunaivibrio sulfuroxidans]WES29974.1 glycosyltransferase [Varunaivibrio sulfuroxidans]
MIEALYVVEMRSRRVIEGEFFELETSGISVIIPHYNHGDVIRRQLNAIRRQTLEADEIIVVDDFSPADKLAEVIEAASEIPTARVVRKEKNDGAARACNVGLAESRGAYVCFLACDDEILPDLFRTAVHFLDTHRKASFVFFDPAVINPHNGEIRTFPLFLSDIPTFIDATEMERVLSKNFFTFSTNTIIFRRSRLDGGMPANLGSFADNFLDFRLALTTGAVYVPKVMGYFYEYPDSYSSKKTLNATVVRKLTNSFLETLEDNETADLYARFRNVGVLPEHSLRAILWLLTTPRGRRYITSRLILRNLTRSAWRIARPLAPHGIRQLMRRVSARRV